eukprot:CAMPEP_0201687374 /NCGR_PEP_ID=MMETSP0578-20130828/1469_1 /ASSEMBLY_ACC=CAM_ASM_000663 /TAXON_ID=267565 /ORGANISM="Skeletonema grethea, Strain CCMP 1804" /LENGTH=76 /DNA_ID=CAMNT_0048171525 /DNA_START=429 /DNA_END=656 /DNA_ORIENTATION=-
MPNLPGFLSGIPSTTLRLIYVRIQEGWQRYYANLEELRIVQKICSFIPVVLRKSGEDLRLGLWLLVQGNLRHEMRW